MSRRFVVQRFAAISMSKSRNNNNYKTITRFITTQSAKSLLGLKVDKKPTIQELRFAYFEMAKQCHPDVQKNDDDATSIDFLELTEAYEYLLHGNRQQQDQQQTTSVIISQQEEEDYRQACLDVLGIPAEIVEESKQNPMFRHWLGGNTDAAQHWRSFFSVHGGLAQKLRPPAGYIQGKLSKTESRRKRSRR